MKKALFIIQLFSVLLFACQNNRNPENQNLQAVEKQDTISHHESEAEEIANPVSLNQEQKWNANSATTEGIKNMKTLAENFPDKPTLNDYHTLKAKMVTEFDLIIQKCTMTGEAHTQLHNYLVPMRKTFEKLNSEDLEVCRKAFSELQEHLNEYENYFI